MEIRNYIDHTLLKPAATRADIEKLCQEAKEHGFYAVCVNSVYAEAAAGFLAGSGVRLAVVCGFPLGAMITAAKAREAELACAAGAAEIDMVMDIGALLGGDEEKCRADMQAVVEAAKAYGAIVKVIIEISQLTDSQIVKACELACAAGAAFVKTSSGFTGHGATEEAVRLMRASCPPEVQVKASGGIRDLDAALRMIRAGASRIGTSSGIAIMKEAAERGL